jgi:transposase-like protein
LNDETKAKVEGERNGTSVPPARPDPEVLAKARRRQFSAEYKLGIVREADGCRNTGDVGALLRREGLYSSHLVTWRRQCRHGALRGLKDSKRGPKAKEQNPLARKVAELERENRKLHQRVEQAETIIAFQKKLASLLEIVRQTEDERGSS